MPTKHSSHLPKTPEFLDKSELFRPSLAMMLHIDAVQSKKEQEAVRTKLASKKKCEDCGFWHEELLGVKCGLCALDCMNSAIKSRFLSKEHYEKAMKGVDVE